MLNTGKHQRGTSMCPRSFKKSNGFTLLEIIIAMSLVGLLTIMASPFFKLFMTARQQNYSIHQQLLNQKIANGLIAHAKENSSVGSLAAPYTGAAGSCVTSAPYNPADVTATAVAPYLVQSGANSNELNTDGTAAQNVRVYQRIQLTQAVPLYFQSGPLMTLPYQFGVLYMTACPKNVAGGTTCSACNPTAATGLPGTSQVVSANTASVNSYQIWQPAGTDSSTVAFSSLPVQKSMQLKTVDRIDKLRDAFGAYFRAKVLSAAASDFTNWYPASTVGGAPNLSGGVPATNQGCRDGWYNLSDANINVLQQIGLTQEEFGRTAWGGIIQFCRDYDPTGTSGVNTPPHYGALRFNRTPYAGTTANNPDTTTLTNNIVLSF